MHFCFLCFAQDKFVCCIVVITSENLILRNEVETEGKWRATSLCFRYRWRNWRGDRYLWRQQVEGQPLVPISLVAPLSPISLVSPLSISWWRGCTVYGLWLEEFTLMFPKSLGMSELRMEDDCKYFRFCEHHWVIKHQCCLILRL